MSQIDEAFIQAYATPQPMTDAVVLGAPLMPPQQVPQEQAPQPQPPLAGLHTGPHIRMPAVKQPVVEPSTVVETQATTWTPEPLPSPHFQIHTAQVDAAQVNTAQAETVDQHSVDHSGVERRLDQLTSRPSGGNLPASKLTAQTQPAASVTADVGVATQRRPLSTFSTPEKPVTTEFSPMFEVDAFRWPKITDDLLSAHPQPLVPVAEQLIEVSEQGRSLIGFAGTRSNVGCSTLLLSLARLVSSVGKKVALVDANFAKASLARDLGLEFEIGWESALKGELPLAECVVNSIQDNMALLPLAKKSTDSVELLDSIQTSVAAGVLRYHYDLVLFNLGTAADSPQDASAFSIMQQCRLDAGIIVADTARTGIDPLDTLLSLFGNNCLGVIGNSAA